VNKTIGKLFESYIGSGQVSLIGTFLDPLFRAKQMVFPSCGPGDYTKQILIIIATSRQQRCAGKKEKGRTSPP